MRGGLLRKRITFQREERLEDEGGGAQMLWNDLTTVWGGYTPERGYERLEAGRLQGNTMGVLRVRSSSETQDIRLSDRAVFDGFAHQIRATGNPDQKDRAIEFVVERGAPTG